MGNELSRLSDVPVILAAATWRRWACLEVLWELPGTWVTGDVLARVGLGLAERGHVVCGVWGATGRWLYEHLDWRWPVEATRDPLSGEWVYSMPADLAAEFKQQAERMKRPARKY